MHLRQTDGRGGATRTDLLQQSHDQRMAIFSSLFNGFLRTALVSTGIGAPAVNNDVVGWEGVNNVG